LTAWLLDTGPLVAYLDAADPRHAEVAAKLDPFHGQLFTTSSVITEAMYFLGEDPRGPRALADWVTTNGVVVYDFCQPPELRSAVALMEKYADTPMDYADATLLLLAEALQTYEILTLDRRGFSTFRTRDVRRPLRLVLDR
jgi:predicted nucleic acid-binding protein